MSLNLRREILGGALNFVAAGTDVEGSPASATVKPTAASGLWDSLGRSVSIKPDKKTTTDGETTYNPDSNKYENEEVVTVVADYLDVVVRDHQAYVWKLLFGIQTMPTDGATAVIPYQEGIREVEGWLQMQARSTQDGVNRTVADLYVKMTIKNYPGWSEKATKPELRLQVLSSDLNTQIFMADI